ncbi:MAG UNVERIFIED_CONTAM: zinc-binding dehydrogenase [Anaerolineae bacterium]
MNGRNENAVEAVKALTDGFGVDYAFISVGNSKVINQGAEMVRMGGTAVIVGLPSTADRMVEFDSFHLGMDRAVMGTKMGTTKLQTDIPRLIDLYNHGQLMLDELISARFTLDQINEAVESSARGEAIRNVIVFE